MEESRRTNECTTRLRSDHVAKPGGKAGGERKGKRADREKDKARAKPGKKQKPGRPGKDGERAVSRGGVLSVLAGSKAVKSKAVKSEAGGSKAAKPKRPRGAQRLVERVAHEIVAAEYDRVVNGSADESAGHDSAGHGAPVREAVEPEGAVQESVGDETGDEAAVGGFSELLRLPAGPVDLAAFDTAATPGVASREKAEAQLSELAPRLDELQERLFAAARGGDSKRRVLLVLQGMDTSGKGGTVRHVVGQLDPNGIRVTAFKAPTEEERAHDFLWRIRNALPAAGEIGIFDRSHYEDVLVARVRKLALPMVIGKRYQLINRFEQGLVADGAVLVKCFLHISPQEQRKRLLARLDDPRKLWKYNPGDVDERALWPQYQEAYRIALEKCSTDDAPWYVIPADHKWYRNYAITRLLVEALERIDPVYPQGEFDVEVERKRLLAA
jgi:PPK2 family polyphosphate:nucleotide phosphotransferase